MTSPLNLYATKVFAEHPISLWAFDENVGYISLLSPSNQNLSNWEVDGATIVNAKDNEVFEEVPPKEPFDYVAVNGIIEFGENNGVINLTTTNPVSNNSFNNNLGSFAIGFYVFTYDRSVQARIGFSYLNTETEEEIEVLRLTNIPANRKWAFLSETFGLPANYSNIKPIIEFSYQKTEIPYELAVNGISFGQWAEEYHTTSLGVYPEDLPEEIPLSSKAVTAFPYGLQGKFAYYLADTNVLYAKNSGVPLVFGSSNSTVISPNPEKPSLIFPGEGFLNQSGQYTSLTAEFWVNIQSNAIDARRIFGPLESDDGVYVEGHLIKLKVGRSVGSHNVGEWGRPMLINIRLNSQSATMLINGEEVISLNISPDTVNYPPKELEDKDLDWLGFYAYEDVPIIQIEGVGIYPYEIPAIVQKRRFVYGQGVEFPTNIKGLNNNNVVFVDYSVSNYSKNYLYPQIGRWRDGFSENIVADKRTLSLPDYQLPLIKFNNKELDIWYQDSYNAQDFEKPFFSLKPTNDWSSTEGYISFRNLALIRENTKAFYGLFETTETNTEKQVLFRFENETQKSSINIVIVNGEIQYSIESLTPSGEVIEEIFYTAYGNAPGQTFLVGLDIDKASQFFGKRVSSFFGAKQSIRVFVGGTKEFSETFTGKIFKIGFCSQRNLSKTKLFFNNEGVPIDYYNLFDDFFSASIFDGGDEYFGNDPDFWDLVLDGGNPDELLEEKNNKKEHIATYTLVPRTSLGSFYLDIAVDSYWENYVPVSYFGKYVPDVRGNSVFSIDFFQFNIDYPKLNRVVNGFYNTEGLPLKTYVSFQFLKSGANANFKSFSKTELLPSNGIVRPGSDWLNTKYEVLNDTIIYPPIGVSPKNIAIVIHIEIESMGIITDQIKIKSLEIASQALGSSPNKIETRFGTPVIPFKRSGDYFAYKDVRPFSIYKKLSPYLYLTNDSGLKLRGEYVSHNRQGMSIPINTNRSRFFKIDLFQMAVRYDEQLFPTAPVQIFEIQSGSEYIKFYLVSDPNNRKRGQIYAIDETTGRLKSGVVYYIDGKVVKRPVLNLNTWTILGMSFEPSLDFESFSGALRITSPLLFNNISYYQSTEEDEVQRFAFRKWSAVRSEIDNPLSWGYWAGKDQTEEGEVFEISEGFTWQEVLLLNEADPILPDASEIYKKYTGTDRFIVDTDNILKISNSESSYYKDVNWSTSVVNAV